MQPVSFCLQHVRHSNKIGTWVLGMVFGGILYDTCKKVKRRIRAVLIQTSAVAIISHRYDNWMVVHSTHIGPGDILPTLVPETFAFF